MYLQGMHSDVPLALVEQIFGHSFDRIEAQHAGMFRFAPDLADEVQTFLSEVNR